MTFATTTNTVNGDGTTTVVTEFTLPPTGPITRETRQLLYSTDGRPLEFTHIQFYDSGNMAYRQVITYASDGHPLTDDLHTWNDDAAQGQPSGTRKGWRHLEYHPTPDANGQRRVAFFHDASYGPNNTNPPGGVGPLHQRAFAYMDQQGYPYKWEWREWHPNPDAEFEDNTERWKYRCTVDLDPTTHRMTHMEFKEIDFSQQTTIIGIEKDYNANGESV